MISFTVGVHKLQVGDQHQPQNQNKKYVKNITIILNFKENAKKCVKILHFLRFFDIILLSENVQKIFAKEEF